MEFSWAISNTKRWCCESAALNTPANLENSTVATKLENVSFHSQPKEKQSQRILKHNCTHLTQFSSVQFNCSVVSNTLPPHESSRSTPTPGGHSTSYASSRWCCHPLRPILLLPPVPPSIRVFFNVSTLLMRWPNIGVSALASVLPINTQNWSHLGWIGWISLQSKGLSRVFFNSTVQKHQFFDAQLSSQSNSHIHTWPLEKP